MIDICLEETALFIGVRVAAFVTTVRRSSVVVVVGPFRKVVGELIAGNVGTGVFEIDDNKLLVLVGGLKQRGLLVFGAEAQDISILGLKLDRKSVV